MLLIWCMDDLNAVGVDPLENLAAALCVEPAYSQTNAAISEGMRFERNVICDDQWTYSCRRQLAPLLNRAECVENDDGTLCVECPERMDVIGPRNASFLWTGSESLIETGKEYFAVWMMDGYGQDFDVDDFDPGTFGLDIQLAECL